MDVQNLWGRFPVVLRARNYLFLLHVILGTLTGWVERTKGKRVTKGFQGQSRQGAQKELRRYSEKGPPLRRIANRQRHHEKGKRRGRRAGGKKKRRDQKRRSRKSYRIEPYLKKSLSRMQPTRRGKGRKRGWREGKRHLEGSKICRAKKKGPHCPNLASFWFCI